MTTPRRRQPFPSPAPTGHASPAAAPGPPLYVPAHPWAAPRGSGRLGVAGQHPRDRGYWQIGVQLDGPLSTVRRWIRAAAPRATHLLEALTALAVAVTVRAQVAPRMPAWTLINQITLVLSVPGQSGEGWSSFASVGALGVRVELGAMGQRSRLWYDALPPSRRNKWNPYMIQYSA